jgi:hypothetical protein
MPDKTTTAARRIYNPRESTVLLAIAAGEIADVACAEIVSPVRGPARIKVTWTDGQSQAMTLDQARRFVAHWS